MARFPRSLSLVPRLLLPGASQDENDTDYETLIRHLLEGQCSNPVQVVAFNTDEGWSRDVSDDVADERCAQRGAVPDFLLDFLEAHDTGRAIQLPLPMGDLDL